MAKIKDRKVVISIKATRIHIMDDGTEKIHSESVRNGITVKDAIKLLAEEIRPE